MSTGHGMTPWQYEVLLAYASYIIQTLDEDQWKHLVLLSFIPTAVK